MQKFGSFHDVTDLNFTCAITINFKHNKNSIQLVPSIFSLTAFIDVYTPQVFVADNASSVAADLISNIAQGRGAALPLDTVSSTHGHKTT